MAAQLNKPTKSLSESTADLSDDSDSDIVVNITIPGKVGDDILTRYHYALKRIVRAISRVEGGYWLEPVLIASNVNDDVLETIPSQYADYRVKCQVITRELFIISLSTGTPHNAGTSSMHQQAMMWNAANGKHFDIFSDASLAFGDAGSSGAPDLVFTIAKKHRLPGQSRRNVAIVELEVGNRSIVQMRRDFLTYFEDPCLTCVVGIKVLGSRLCPIECAAAVQWSRFPNGTITVTAVRDFGIEPMPATAARYFAANDNAALPGVAADAWSANRHIPVVVGDLPLPENGILTVVDAMNWIAAQDDETGLFAHSTTPTIAFPAADLTASLVNMPANAAPLQDFHLNFSDVLYWVARGAV